MKKPRDPYPFSGFETIGSFSELESVAEGSVWQGFERLAAFIFERNGFAVSVGTVKTRNRQRRQYDVIARKDGRTLLAECKRWSCSRYRLSALRAEALRHRERALFYEDVTGTDSVPLIVTLIDENIRILEGVPLVPLYQLNAFIGELDRYAGDFSSAEPDEGRDPTGDGRVDRSDDDGERDDGPPLRKNPGRGGD